MSLPTTSLHNRKMRGMRPLAQLGWVGRAPIHASRTRSNHPRSAAALRRNRCICKRPGKRRSASSPLLKWCNADRLWSIQASCRLGEIANPGSARTQTEQDERPNTARRSREGSDEPSRCRQALLPPDIGGSKFPVDCHGPQDASCRDYRIKDFSHACDHSFASRTYAHW